MKYNKIGSTEYEISEIGFGAEWMVDKTQEEVNKIINHCYENGINFIDCWMSDPKVRSLLGEAIKDNRNKWIIQGHIGSTWQNGQYVRTREMDKVIPAFKDLMTRFHTDYMDFGMIHYVDKVEEYEKIINGEFYEYVKKLKDSNTIRHIGLSTHNPEVGILAAKNPDIELIMFSLNPAFDMMPAVVLDDYFVKEKYDENLSGMQPIRLKFYQTCEETDTAITVMKGYDGGRLFNEEESPFSIALNPIQCIHYALTRPNSKSILVGIKNIDELNDALYYENAPEEEKDFNKILTEAPNHSYLGKCTYCGHCAPCPVKINVAIVNKFYDLAIMQDEVPESIQEHYNNLGAYASSCTECGGCEQRCPFDVKVIDIMQKASKIFGK